jgi:spore maturation protein CgeB
MFGEKSLIEKCDREMVSKDKYFQEKQMRIFFSGSLFNHEDDEIQYYRNRIKIYNEIYMYIYNPGQLKYDIFLNEIRNSKFSLDLLGVGEPNKRTFEILLSGSLIISQKNDLLWPFEEQFTEETIFKDKNDFVEKITKLISNNELYNKCLINQYNIVKKYLNKNWIREYIINKI